MPHGEVSESGSDLLFYFGCCTFCFPSPLSQFAGSITLNSGCVLLELLERFRLIALQ